MKAKELFDKIYSRLSKISTEPEDETLIILEKLFGLKKIDLYLNKELIQEKSEIIEDILLKREKRIPLQYILKEQHFRNYSFYVDERVLIPRPETEILVDKVIELKNTYFPSEKVLIADIGCGSGAIAICIALEIPESLVYAVDISKDALDVTEENKKRLNISNNRLILLKSDKFDSFNDKEIKFDFIVSNPPYIPYKDYLELEPEVKENEPEIALVGIEDDGLGFYRYFASEGKKLLKPGGFLCFEIGYGQGGFIADILKIEESLYDIRIFNDYNNIERVVTARLKYENFTG